MEASGESLGEVQFWLDPDDEEDSIVGVFSRVVHRQDSLTLISPFKLNFNAMIRLVPSLIEIRGEEEIFPEDNIQQQMNEMSIAAEEPLLENFVEPPVALEEKVMSEVVQKIAPLVPGPFKEPGKKQKRSVR